MPILLLFFLFIVVPIAELYVLLQIGQQIGALATIALLILASVLGASLMCAQGRATWLRFSTALAEGRMPGREAVDGALVLFGGALLLTPGFLTDILGLILLVPPTRALVRTLLLKRAMGRVAAAGGSGAPIRIFAFGSPRPAGPRPARRDEDVVDSSARDADDRRGELP
jgi:UPF0716 protein FxsA